MTKFKQWHVGTSLEILKKRAKITQNIMNFFNSRGFLHVNTPLLGPTTIIDENIDSIQTNYDNYYLQTSPEFYMKRVLATYPDQAIFQICKAFRHEAFSKKHNYEFEMLEYYRPNCTLTDFMAELQKFLLLLLPDSFSENVYYFTYQELFKYFVNIDISNTTISELRFACRDNALSEGLELDFDGYLDLVYGILIEPKLKGVVFITDFPASKAGLAQVKNGVAERFEVVIDGWEIANGFNELRDSKIQRKRFEEANKKRQKKHLPPLMMDTNFLFCLDDLPQCIGVSVGLDRLITKMLNCNALCETVNFLCN